MLSHLHEPLFVWSCGYHVTDFPLALSRVAAVAYVKSGAVATTIRAGNVPTRSNMCAGDWGGPLIKWSPASQTVVSDGRVESGLCGLVVIA